MISIRIIARRSRADARRGVPSSSKLCADRSLFGGLTVEETAQVLGVDRKTVMRDWGR
jgi:hypothetical protein